MRKNMKNTFRLKSLVISFGFASTLLMIETAGAAAPVTLDAALPEYVQPVVSPEISPAWF